MVDPLYVVQNAPNFLAPVEWYHVFEWKI